MKHVLANMYPKKEYNDLYSFSLYSKVINLFFQLIAKEILKGYQFDMRNGLGRISIIKKARNLESKQVDFGKTRLNKRQGIDEIIYRTNTSYYKFKWLKIPFSDSVLSYFKFKACWHNERAIPKYEHILEISSLKI